MRSYQHRRHRYVACVLCFVDVTYFIKSTSIPAWFKAIIVILIHWQTDRFALLFQTKFQLVSWSSIYLLENDNTFFSYSKQFKCHSSLLVNGLWNTNLQGAVKFSFPCLWKRAVARQKINILIKFTVNHVPHKIDKV